MTHHHVTQGLSSEAVGVLQNDNCNGLYNLPSPWR